MDDKPACIELANTSFQWPQTNSPLIEIEHLTIDYGEHIFIQGASGSGKSTLLNLLTGVLTPTSGSLRILNQRLDSLPQSRRDQFRADHCGVIFQQFNLLPYLTVLDNVTLPLSFSQYRYQRAMRVVDNIREQAVSLLDALGISVNLFNQNVTQLSTGQQQRVAAARALIGAPEIIVADEPTSALDADTKHSFLETLFSQTQKTHSTVIFVSHDQTLSDMFDRTLLISQLKQ